MKILIIGNIFRSLSLQIKNFCDMDSEENIINMSKQDSGAAIVVSTFAALLDCNPILLSKIGNCTEFESLFEKLKKIKVDLSQLIITNSKNNFLLTIYNKYYDRKGYSYIPNGIETEDLISLDYSDYDAVFFCFLHADIISQVFKYNTSILNTVSVLISSGISYEYFRQNKLLINPSYFFVNRGELENICKKELTTGQTMADLECGNTCMVITMGKNGVLIKEKESINHYSVTPVENIKHPGGAGDAFAAGFIAAKLRGKNNEECCRKGHECSQIMLQASSIETIINKYI